jgi:hypothetical protein
MSHLHLYTAAMWTSTESYRQLKAAEFSEPQASISYWSEKSRSDANESATPPPVIANEGSLVIDVAIDREHPTAPLADRLPGGVVSGGATWDSKSREGRRVKV